MGPNPLNFQHSEPNVEGSDSHFLVQNPHFSAQVLISRPGSPISASKFAFFSTIFNRRSLKIVIFRTWSLTRSRKGRDYPSVAGNARALPEIPERISSGGGGSRALPEVPESCRKYPISTPGLAEEFRSFGTSSRALRDLQRPLGPPPEPFRILIQPPRTP